MSVLSWGNPKVEYGKSTNGAAATTWEEFTEIKEGSASLNVTEGELIEATDEGGNVVDSRRKANKYVFTCEIFVQKGKEKPGITDTNGIILDNYSLRLTPEDETCEGFILDKCNVTVAESWTAADGKLLRYTFNGIKPADGIICKPYPSKA